jgi:hypothetical protein
MPFGLFRLLDIGSQELAETDMDQKIADFLNRLPDNAPRSKLEPHSDIIAALRKKRYTYRQISQFLCDHLQLDAAPSTIHDFIRVRRGRGKRTDAPAVESRPNAKPRTTPENSPSATPNDLQKKIAALKHRSHNDGETNPRFVYDEAEPLRLLEIPSNGKPDHKN